jgi:hypothetical protein
MFRFNILMLLGCAGEPPARKRRGDLARPRSDMIETER